MAIAAQVPLCFSKVAADATVILLPQNKSVDFGTDSGKEGRADQGRTCEISHSAPESESNIFAIFSSSVLVRQASSALCISTSVIISLLPRDTSVRGRAYRLNLPCSQNLRAMGATLSCTGTAFHASPTWQIHRRTFSRLLFGTLHPQLCLACCRKMSGSRSESVRCIVHECNPESAPACSSPYLWSFSNFHDRLVLSLPLTKKSGTQRESVSLPTSFPSVGRFATLEELTNYRPFSFSPARHCTFFSPSPHFLFAFALEILIA